MISALALTASGNEPDQNTVAKYMPSDAYAFFTVALDPSLKQKGMLALMSRSLPEEVRADDAKNVRDTFLKGLFKSSGTDYEKEM